MKSNILRLSLDAIAVVDAIDRRGSFTAAAEELYKVPSTISYTVAKLEEDLGVAVFQRSGPRIWLTDAGRELLREGRELLKRAGDLERRVKRVATGWETEVRVALDSVFSPTLFEDGVRDFCAIADTTRLTLQSQVLTGCWEALVDGRADVVLAVGEGPSVSGYQAEAIGSISYVFCVAPSHPLARAKKPVRSEQMQAHKAIVVSDSARRLPPRTVGVLWDQDAIAVADMYTKIAFQMAGLGFGFLPRGVAGQFASQGKLVVLQVDAPRKPDEIVLAWRKDEMGNAVSWWLDYFRSDAVRGRLAALYSPSG